MCGVWTSLDHASKLFINWDTSPTRAPEHATRFMKNLQSRLTTRVQLSTDGLHSYLTAVQESFGRDVDYAQLVKHYNRKQRPQRDDDYRYSPKDQEFTTRTIILGNPNNEKINTSFVERHNLTMRMAMRRFTRLTNAYSKKLSNHRHMLALYSVWYNFVKHHSTIKTTPAVAAGIADQRRDLNWILDLVDGRVRMPSGIKRSMRKTGRILYKIDEKDNTWYYRTTKEYRGFRLGQATLQ